MAELQQELDMRNAQGWNLLSCLKRQKLDFILEKHRFQISKN